MTTKKNALAASTALVTEAEPIAPRAPRITPEMAAAAAREKRAKMAADAKAGKRPGQQYQYDRRPVSSLEGLIPGSDFIAGIFGMLGAMDALEAPKETAMVLWNAIHESDPESDVSNPEAEERGLAPLTYWSGADGKQEKLTTCGIILQGVGEQFARSAYFAGTRFTNATSEYRALRTGTKLHIDGEGNRHVLRDSDRENVGPQEADAVDRARTQMIRAAQQAWYYGQVAMTFNDLFTAHTGKEITYSIRVEKALTVSKEELAEKAALQARLDAEMDKFLGA